ncbi:Solute carrier family 22 member 13 [Armadillidium vulgare]|nr:Solute carrier family 22 member 13 [Armadillidium vulgare]
MSNTKNHENQIETCETNFKSSSNDSISENTSGNASRAYEIILKECGDYHLYQWWLTFLGGLTGIFTGMHGMAATEMTIKFMEERFVTDQFLKQSANWDLVCDNKWYISGVQSTFMIGYLVGALIFSAISDKKGRRYSTLVGVCLLVISSISIAFVNSYTMFIILRLILAASAHGIGLSTFVLSNKTKNKNPKVKKQAERFIITLRPFELTVSITVRKKGKQNILNTVI